MTEKDLNSSQNIDLGKKNEEPQIPDEKKKYSDDASGVAEVNVKNAHASGDGSMGRANEKADDPHSGDPQID